MVDHSKIPNEADWDRMLDELDDHVAFLRKHGPTVRARAKGASSPYPGRSPGSNAAGGSVGGLGDSSDPTGDYVIRLAGGADENPDTWQGTRDPVAMHARRMWTEAFDARNRLRGSTAAARLALPTEIREAVREQCQSCGTPKAIATKHGKQPSGWVVAEGRCQGCSSRIKRAGKAKAS